MTFSSFRRNYLDEFLAATPFSGDVLDVGGKKENKKGRFRPPLANCRSWRYVNVDAASRPDLLASADSLPLDPSTVDYVLLSEVLEHLEKPEKSLAEACRVLRSGGKLVLSVPFLFPVHGDPFDFQRWTPQKFRLALAELGFGEIEVHPMGGLIAVVADIFEGYCQAHYTNGLRIPLLQRVLRRLMRGIFLPVLLRKDKAMPFKDSVTGGYFVIARKLT